MNHDLTGSTTDIKTYKTVDNSNPYFDFNKKDALTLVRDVLKNISEIVFLGDMYEMLNLIPEEEYEPLISDETITLSLAGEFGDKHPNKTVSQTLDIILNETFEKVGMIHFDYSIDVSSDHSPGNVCYKIGESFQNKGYATKALKLLKEYLGNLKYKGNKDLYFWVSYDNILSQKVVLSNGGEVVKEDPKDNDPLDNGYTYRIKI